ncbi:hypothetical protein [Pelagicoccus mobilis]|uniref:Uncharacterized protein n=1 Tax=Pelagicoccus mobilis TaxID=415221 RepID=A0A934RVR8_9BACT|nr:hypothetical protein [Pelagicoccus mobilis]MBK1875701.1 hypothetical protein [Pelagicoccus mobilis]
MEPLLKKNFRVAAALLAMCLLTALGRAQWQTQSFVLSPGWNAVNVHVDMQHTSLADLLGSTPVTEVWLWKPDLSTLQFVTSPQDPLDTNSRWLSWKKAFPLEATLSSIIGNASYLIRVDESRGSNYTLELKGKPVPPRSFWSSDGANFLGFSTVGTNPPSFYDFLEPVPDVRLNAELYEYVGGPIADNPARVFDLRSEKVERGKAFWIRADGVYNRYYAPFEISLQKSEGVDFGKNASVYRVRIKNNTDEDLDVSLASVASETPPAGQASIEGAPEVLVRGAFSVDTLSHSFSRLSESDGSWTLAPKGAEGSEVDVILGLDRSGMTAEADSFYAGLLRFTDSLGYAQYDIPVTATKGNVAGLWVGEAVVSEVRHNLGFFERVGEEVREIDRNVEFGTVARPFKLRLIVHVAEDGTSHLLQRVFYGLDDANQPVLSTKEENLNVEQLDIARRISASHLPWTEGNDPWLLTGGDFGQGESVEVEVTLGADDHRSNPFLHSYHPDHDNRNATFSSSLGQGIESYGVTRTLHLEFDPPSDDFDSLTSGGVDIGGVYLEEIELAGSGTNNESYEVKGSFSLTRLNDLGTLLTTVSE